MVKKISGSKPPAADGAGKVEPTKAVGTSKVKDTGEVAGTAKQARAGRVRRPTRPMSSKEREHLFQLIHEEAEKMFGPNGLPESQRNTVEGAVKQTIDASIIDDEE